MPSRRLTEIEWQALQDALCLQDVVWEQDGDEMHEPGSPPVNAKRRALDRASEKLRALKPAGVA